MHTRPGIRRTAWLAAVVVLSASAVASLGMSPPAVAAVAAATAAPPGSVTVSVKASHTVGSVTGGTAVGTYQWMLSPEDTGNPKDASANCLPEVGSSKLLTSPQAGSTDPATTCAWPSVRSTYGGVSVWASGNQADFAGGKAVAGVPAGRYLLSVTAPGFRIDGAHLTVPSGGTVAVPVTMDPYPLPLGTVRVRAFKDQAPVDGTYEVGVEEPLVGFTATISDVLGQVTDDYFGNPLCSVYQAATSPGTPNDPKTSNGAPVAADQTNADGRSDPVFLDGTTGKPVLLSSPGCKSDSKGDVAIPNVGNDRYTANVIPPAGSGWIQTTTLEGNHDWDVWPQQGDTGFDTELTVGAEKVPAVDFGFVQPRALPAGPTGHVKGVLDRLDTYIPGNGGVPVAGAGVSGGKIVGPLTDGVVSLSDLGNADQMVYTGLAKADGSFDIAGVPDGDYQLTYWDVRQDYILNSQNVSVQGGKTTDVGVQGLTGWWTTVHGSVFYDDNQDGKRDNGEQGVQGFTVTLKGRDNTLLIEGGINNAKTDDAGNYTLTEGYPLGRWLIEEFFNTGFKTTGVTVQADNEPQEKTYLGSGVDLSLLPIISLGGRVDIGVQRYGATENGGIVGTVTYDSTRNELDPRYALTEDYQPGVPDIPLHLYAPVTCAPATYGTAADGSTCSPSTGSPTGGYVAEPTGALRHGPELNDPYTSERYVAPTGCEPRQVDGSPLSYDSQLAVPATGDGSDPAATCVEAPMTGWVVKPSEHDATSFGQTVNGNYGFTDANRNLYAPGNAANPAPGHDLPLYAPLQCTVLSDECTAAVRATPSLAPASTSTPVTTGYEYANQPLTASQYLVALDVPKDGLGRPTYKVTDEASVNIFDGAGYAPQGDFPWTSPWTAADGGNVDQPTPGQPPTQQANDLQWPPCAGASTTVDITDPAFRAGGGSPFQGASRPSCDTKLMTVRSGQSVAPNFSLYTDVPLPTHFWGLVINDLGLSNDPTSVSFGEAEPLPNVPVGFYDWSGKLDDTVHADRNGFYEALEPSTDTYNCPLPAGPCPGIYRLVGNDPGQPGALNPDYNPRYRTIATNFQAWPGNYIATDLAPTQVAAVAVTPGSKQATPVDCTTPATLPQLLAASTPYVRVNTPTTVDLTGYGFGAAKGTLGSVSATGGVSPLPNGWSYTWSDTKVTLSVPANTTTGTYALSLRTAAGKTAVDTLTLRVFSGSKNIGSQSPAVVTLNAPTPDPFAQRNYSTVPRAGFTTVTDPAYAVQEALTYASTFDTSASNGVDPVLAVYPAPASSANPRGEYFESIVSSARVDLQGVGPGGFTPAGTWVAGSMLDGRGFSADNAQGTHWLATVNAATYYGKALAQVPDAATVTFLARTDPGYGWTATRHASLDGFTVTGGTQNDVGGNVGAINGNVSTGGTPTGALITQGGGIYVHAAAHYLQISDDVVVGNSGAYAGGIRVGTPYSLGLLPNRNVTITRNRIRDNGGTNLAGGVGLFVGSDGYKVSGNDLCGNFSAEYGGAVSQYGRSPGGSIDHNRIWFNESYDEGGGVMVAGELATTLGRLSPGTGEESVKNNLIAENLANDDGGGLRFLQAGSSPMHVSDNAIVDNVSTHEGGGVALDDTTDVRFVNNTVAKNLTTATAITSNGLPAPAGLSTAANSAQLQATLPSTAAKFSKPTLVDDLFYDNRAGSWDGALARVTGIGMAGDPTAVNRWDAANVDQTTADATRLSATTSLFQSKAGVGLDTTSLNSTSNVFGLDPLFATPVDVSVSVQTWRNLPAFRQSVIVATAVPPSLASDYRPLPGSPAVDRGATPTLANEVPAGDLDGTAWDVVTGVVKPDIGSYVTKK